MGAPSRTSLIAMLVAVEVAIAGFAVYSLRGGGFHMDFASAHSGAGFVAKTFAPVQAGAAPQITIDDPNSGVTVSASRDGLVHVVDDTYFHGGPNYGGYPQLTVTRDLSGVHISRAAYHEGVGFFIGMWDSRQHFEVQVPAAATLAIGHCANAEISGLSGGTIAAHCDDGHIAVDHVATSSLDVNSGDGSVEATNLTLTGSAPTVTLHSADGHIRASGRFPAGGTYDFTTNDGGIYIALEPGSDVTVDALTEDGAISVDGQRRRDFDQGDPANGTLRFGSGASSMHVRTQDGSIRITTNGAN